MTSGEVLLDQTNPDVLMDQTVVDQAAPTVTVADHQSEPNKDAYSENSDV